MLDTRFPHSLATCFLHMYMHTQNHRGKMRMVTGWTGTRKSEERKTERQSIPTSSADEISVSNSHYNMKQDSKLCCSVFSKAANSHTQEATRQSKTVVHTNFRKAVNNEQ